ncbi:MAG: low molecular weight phosphotyrosine protein phosphatase [Lachnospiraceae bacterium]|nr:low molecular weight phosphotyrosine protein phosphatase [Lachnospiraceae bacterium]
MIKILFVCHGNICRSPMGMFILRKMVREEGIDSFFQIDSAATSREELGNPVYPPARRKLIEMGIDPSGHKAHQMTRKEYDEYDYIIAMDQWNLRNIDRIIGSDTEGKVSLCLDYTDEPADISDPWYTGDFDTAYNDIYRGCEGFLEFVKKEHPEIRQG